jgi:integrase
MSDRFHSGLESPETPNHLLDRAIRDGRIEENTRQLIIKYLNYLQGARSASPIYSTNATAQLILWRSLLGIPFEEATFDDLIGARVALDKVKSKRGKPYAEASKKTYVIALKSFYLWLERRGLTSVTGHELREMRIPDPEPTTTPDDLIRGDDLKGLIGRCDNFRDRALISVLFETGARISEIHRLRWKDIVFDRYGARVTLHDHKQKKDRYSRLVVSVPHLAAWRNAYPGDPVGDKHVFISTRDSTPLSYSMMRYIVVSTSGSSKKRVTPHLFRKSRITELITTGCSESVVKESCWGNPNSRMFVHYLRLSATDVDAGLLRAAGVEVSEDDRIQPRSVIHCPSCHAVCAPEFRFCPLCMHPLTAEAVESVKEKESALLGVAQSDDATARAALQRMIRTELERLSLSKV